MSTRPRAKPVFIPNGNTTLESSIYFYFILFYNFFRKEIALLFAPSLSQKGLMLLDENENFVDSSNLCQLFLSFLFLLFFSFIFSLIVLRKEFMAFLQLFASMVASLLPSSAVTFDACFPIYGTTIYNEFFGDRLQYNVKATVVKGKGDTDNTFDLEYLSFIILF